MLKKIIVLLLVIAALVYAALVFLPWNDMLAGRIAAMIEAQGIDVASLRVEKITPREMILSDVVLTGDPPLRFDNIALHYSWRELLDGKFDNLVLYGMDVTLQRTGDGWRVSGLPVTGGGAGAPTLNDVVARIPFTYASIKDSTLHVRSPSLNAALPFTLSLDKRENTHLALSIAENTVRSGDADIILSPFTAHLDGNARGEWTGNWEIAGIDIGDITPMPPLSGGGTLTVKNNILTMGGNLDSADRAYRGAFGLLIDPAAPQAGKATINALSLPFKEGRLSSKNITIPLSGTDPIRVNLEVQQVSVDAMLQTLTGKRVTATGTFSGSVPLIIGRDGSYTLGKGALKADGTGVIHMAPEAIPGDNPQVALVRDILQNLNYSNLSIAVDSAKGRAITVKLTLEGNNPDMFDGRPVKLNVNLSGDVLDFVQQNIMLITNPEKLLKQGAYE